jgi:hypothetical protein
MPFSFDASKFGQAVVNVWQAVVTLINWTVDSNILFRSFRADILAEEDMAWNSRWTSSRRQMRCTVFWMSADHQEWKKILE